VNQGLRPSTGDPERERGRYYQYTVSRQQTGRVRLITVEQSHARDNQMGADHPDDLSPVLLVQGREEDDAPERVQEDETQSGGSGYDEEVLGTLPQSHSTGPDRVGQDVD